MSDAECFIDLDIVHILFDIWLKRNSQKIVAQNEYKHGYQMKHNIPKLNEIL